MNLFIRELPGTDERILWIHGYTLSSEIWSELWDELPGFHHIGVDLPGHGRSRALAQSDTLVTLASEINAIAKRYHARHIVALSFGTLVALEAAIQAPAFFESVTLAAPSVGGGPTDLAVQRRNGELRRLYRNRGAGTWMGDLWMQTPTPVFAGIMKHPQRLAMLRAIVQQHGWLEMGDATMQRLTEWPQQSHRLHAVRARVTIMVGSDDMLVFRRTAHTLAQAIPSCYVVHIEDAGHLCLLEYPQTCATVIQASIRGVGYSADQARPGVT